MAYMFLWEQQQAVVTTCQIIILQEVCNYGEHETYVDATDEEWLEFIDRLKKRSEEEKLE